MSRARYTEEDEVEKTRERVNGICSQDDFVRDSVIGEGKQSRNAVREDISLPHLLFSDEPFPLYARPHSICEPNHKS